VSPRIDTLTGRRTAGVSGAARGCWVDPDFAATVDTDNYHVFLTEYDDNTGQYVKRSATGFVVRAKTSDTANGTFSYRVVAWRGDIEAPRLEKVNMSTIEVARETSSVAAARRA